ncbi:MAG: DNA-deoxyinosine glycosylase [Firmicutes bacterium]|nr:DNA-deoxyinosine glycosylase [Bacillota bacterium]
MKSKQFYQHVIHTFGPLYNADSRILILGSIPSPASREVGFYYGHPRNRFWPMLAELFAVPLPESIEEKKALVLSHGLALWDAIEECDIIGASDSSVKNVVPTVIPTLLAETKVERILCNGALSKKIYDKYQLEGTGISAQQMPSTSPANAAWSLERLVEEWGKALR